MLEGDTVLQAPAARRGLELLQQHAADLHLVLSDLKMPGANGVDLLPRYKSAYPKAVRSSSSWQRAASS